MLQRSCVFIVALTLFWHFGASPQIEIFKKPSSLRLSADHGFGVLAASHTLDKAPAPYFPKLKFLAIPAIEPDLFTKHSGFFCRKEWGLEKFTNIAFRFRLGSLNYCNSMEGKNAGENNSIYYHR